VRYAQSRGIPASARGSACGALVSYVLKLSHVDPLEYDLLFERFLDPNRSEAPDIDIDFCQERREEVIAYVRQKYGEQSVAQIVTFGTLAAKAAIRDVGRVLDIPLDRVNRLTNMVPKVLNITLDDSLIQSPDLKKEYDTDPDVRRLIDIARKLEGTNRQAGTHAAGVVIANGDLTDYVPLHRVMRKGQEISKSGGEAVVTTQWVMGDLERVGLLKMDFLGLRTLTVMDNAVKLIDKTQGIKVDLATIPLNDEKTFALLQRGDAKGVFQLESDGIRELLKRMKPDSIRDLIATNALYRPGPLGGGMVDAYVNRKHGREKPVYQHPLMEEILAETHGVLVYQEQCMRVLNRLGGIELASAYACIKAISKKKQEIIDERKAEFLKGAQERGLTEDTAEKIFDLIIQFAGYGFNKSHSAAYALIGYQTAYLKAHYPAEFMAALLSSEIEDSNKRDIMVQHIDDARRLGAEVLPPDVQAGDVDFTVENGKIIFGLTAIKGLGRGAAAEIVRARQEKGPFKDLFDFCERVDSKIVSRAAMEKLIKVGAFDRTGANRAQLWEALPRAIACAGEVQEDRRHGQHSLFEELAETTADSAQAAEGLKDIPEWATNEKLKYEKEALDFYISSHPLAQHEEELSRFSTHTVNQLAELGPNQEVFIGGMLTQVRFMNTKKARNGNSRYARCKIEDFTGSVECVMWPEDFVRYKDLIAEDQIVFVQGAVERTREEPGLVLTRILSVEDGKRARTTGLVLLFDMTQHSPNLVDAVANVLKRAPGSLPVFLHIRDASGRWAKLKGSDAFRINQATLVKSELETLLGPGRVQFARQANGNGRNGH
jgi:DNA polymerase-3 subunit alpha